jgi:hypothetical protein
LRGKRRHGPGQIGRRYVPFHPARDCFHRMEGVIHAKR